MHKKKISINIISAIEDPEFELMIKKAEEDPSQQVPVLSRIIAELRANYARL